MNGVGLTTVGRLLDIANAKPQQSTPPSMTPHFTTPLPQAANVIARAMGYKEPTLALSEEEKDREQRDRLRAFELASPWPPILQILP